MAATRRRVGRLTTRAWGLILGLALVLPLLVAILVDRSRVMGRWPWRPGFQRSFVYVLASPWLGLAFVVGMWLLFMALVIGRRQRLFLWSFILLAWTYTLGAAGLVRMFGPMGAPEWPSLRALFSTQWTIGGTWVGFLWLFGAVVVIAVLEQVLRRRSGRRVRV
jgi:hypothetical protein